MLAAGCMPGSAVTVRAADDFYGYIDGWRGVIADMPSQAGGVWVQCTPPDDQQQNDTLLLFLIPPDQLEPAHDETTEN